MNEEKKPQLDPNEASLEQLKSLPGIGQGLAQRMMAARPFSDHADLLRVRGVGKNLLVQIEPYFSFNHVHAVDIVAEEGDLPGTVLESELDRPQDQLDDIGAVSEELIEVQPDSNDFAVESESVLAADPVQTKSVGVSEPLRREHLVWWLAGTGFITMIVSILVSLLIMAGINGTLNYSRHRQIVQMAEMTDNIGMQVDLLVSDLGLMEQRLEVLEGLTGRMTTVETQVTDLKIKVDETEATVLDVASQVQILAAMTDKMAEEMAGFSSFFTGLQTLLDDVFSFPQVVE